MVGEEQLLGASRWRSVSEIPNFPFSSFGDVQRAVADGQCYLSVDDSKAYRFAHLTSSRRARAFNGFLSWVPILAALAYLVAAIMKRNAWLLLGLPGAALGFVIGASSVNLVRSFLTSAARDPAEALASLRGLFLPIPVSLFVVAHKPAVALPCRAAARVLLRMMPFGPIAGIVLFVFLLFTDHDVAAWIVASYLVSVHALRSLRARATIALNSAAKRSEAFFLFALSQGLCGLRDKATGEFIGFKPWTQKQAPRRG